VLKQNVKYLQIKSCCLVFMDLPAFESDIHVLTSGFSSVATECSHHNLSVGRGIEYQVLVRYFKPDVNFAF